MLNLVQCAGVEDKSLSYGGSDVIDIHLMSWILPIDIWSALIW
jgi:hypothetical protein